MTTLRTNPKSFVRSLIAELVGTFLLLLAALLAPPNLTFVAVGLTLLVLVFAVGKVSGSHVNPAVTLSLVTARKFKPVDGVLYVVAQILGAFLAVVAMRLLGLKTLPVEAAANAFWFEFLGAFLLTFVVATVLVKNVPEAGSGLAIGGALTLGALLAGGASGGVLNPALALALLSSGVVRGPLVYLVAPLLAGVAGGLLASFVRHGETPDENS